MKKYKTIEPEYKNSLCTVWLNRPEVHNAFNDEMLSDLIDCFEAINKNNNLISVIIRGKGKTFCGGADLNWMRNVAKYTYEQNYQDSLQLSKCFYTIYTCKKPTIAIVHGASIGGANGMLASCDFAYCADDTVFSLSEVKIGIIPACISPYVTKRVGEYGSKELMLTGKRFNGKEAEKYRLVNKSLEPDKLDEYVNSVIDNLKTSGPMAMAHCKNLIYNISNKLTLNQASEYTAKMIADIRSSEEGQEGIAAFFEKRKPKWIVD